MATEIMIDKLYVVVKSRSKRVILLAFMFVCLDNQISRRGSHIDNIAISTIEFITNFDKVFDFVFFVDKLL